MVAPCKGCEWYCKASATSVLVPLRCWPEQGCEIVAVGDIYGAIISKDGRALPIGDLIEHVKKTGSVVAFPATQPINNQDLLLIDCEALIPAAMECVLHKGNAGEVKAKVIAEAANLPTTPEADEIFRSRGITVLPDILTNAGGVVVSFFEWTQNLQQVYWDEEKVNTVTVSLPSAGLSRCRESSGKRESYPAASCLRDRD